MKTYKNYFRYFSLICCFWSFFGCENEGLKEYTDNPGIYFDGAERSYSFFDHPGIQVDTIKLPLLISGPVCDYDRIVKVEVVSDTNTTATDDMYQLLDGYVLKGEAKGIVPVVLNYREALENQACKLKIRLVETKDFKELRLGQNTCLIHFSAYIIKPDNWDSWLHYYFGDIYSTRWWKFIMDATGKNALPYNPTHPDKETWWMSDAELIANYWLVRNALNEYNANPENNPPLRHDDGEGAGQIVVMPEM